MPSIVISLLAVVIVACGVGLAYVLYGRRAIPSETPEDVSVFTKFARADLGGDIINEELVIRPGMALVDGLLVFDSGFVDGGATAPSTSLRAVSKAVSRKIQNGYVRSYALSILFGAALVLFVLTAVNW